jgi:hypothetical protein
MVKAIVKSADISDDLQTAASMFVMFVEICL